MQGIENIRTENFSFIQKKIYFVPKDCSFIMSQECGVGCVVVFASNVTEKKITPKNLLA